MKDAAVNDLHVDAVRQHLHGRLKVVTLRGVTIKALDNALQDHDDWALDGFFLWLQDQLKSWKNPDPDVYRPQIQSICDRLRNRHQDDKCIIDSFQLWKSAQTSIDPSIQPRVILIGSVLKQYLYRKKQGTATSSPHPSIRQSSGPDLDTPHAMLPHKPIPPADSLPKRSRSKEEANSQMKKRGTSENSPGSEDSEVEFMGTKSPNESPGHPMKERKETLKLSSLSVPKDTQNILDGCYNGDHRLSATEARGSMEENKAGKLNKGRYICNRCHKSGKVNQISTH